MNVFFDRYALRASLLLAMTIVGIMTIFSLQSEDIFMYLAIGRRIWSTGAWPALDPFLFSIPNYDWHIEHEWLSYPIFFSVYSLAGYGGVILFKSALILASVGTSIWVARQENLKSFWLPILLLIVAYSASHRFIVRASTVSDLLTVALMATLLRPVNWKVCAAIVMSFAFWVNFHPGYPIGWALIGIALICSVFQGDKLRQKILAVTLFGSCLVTLANPLFVEGAIYPLTKSLSPEWEIFRQSNYEWMPTFSSVYRSTKEAWALGTLMVVATVLTLITKKYRDGQFTGFLLLALFLGSYATRFVSVSSYLLGVLIVLTLKPLGEMITIQPPRKLLSFAVPAGLVILLMALLKWGYWGAAGHRTLGLGIDERFFPVQAAKIVKEGGSTGNVFNEYGWGAYLAWVWDGEPKIFYHGHIDRPEFYREGYMGTGKSAERFQSTVMEHNIRTFLLDKRRLRLSPPPIIYLELQKPPWKKAYEGLYSVLFIR